MATTLSTRGLNIPAHDNITLVPSAAPSDGDQVITYLKEGSVVAVLTVTYVGGNVSAVVRSAS
ncbi:MAG: hypothetical protein GY886_11315 [Gammaproteobacteria bacterium]|nr:hypothetical protein [Gammaproteobacteria bacterium]